MNNGTGRALTFSADAVPFDTAPFAEDAMTVDMLAAAFIWPEEILIGRTHIGDDLEPIASVVSRPPAEPVPDDARPFWAALMHRFRADRLSPHGEVR